MIEAIKYDVAGKETGKVELNEKLFGVETKNPEALIYEVINMYRANQRQGTSKVKGRSEKQGSGRKLFQQKGTGNARMGNNRTPVRVGGGTAFGPLPKDWYRKIPKKKKRLALKLALTAKAENDDIIVVDNFDFEKPNTKKAAEIINKLSADTKNLVVIDGSDKAVVSSFKNLKRVEMNRADLLFAYQVLNNDKVIITVDGLNKLMEVFAK